MKIMKLASITAILAATCSSEMLAAFRLAATSPIPRDGTLHTLHSGNLILSLHTYRLLVYFAVKIHYFIATLVSIFCQMTNSEAYTE